jgi:hypothetical protein
MVNQYTVTGGGGGGTTDSTERTIELRTPEGPGRQEYCLVFDGGLEENLDVGEVGYSTYVNDDGAYGVSAGGVDTYRGLGAIYLKNHGNSEIHIRTQGGELIGVVSAGSSQHFRGYVEGAEQACETLKSQAYATLEFYSGGGAEQPTGADGTDGTSGSDGTGGSGGSGALLSGLPIPELVPGVGPLSSKATTLVVGILALAVLGTVSG